MSDKPEPLAAILAEMRKAVVPMICGRQKIEAVSIRDVLQWADRIEVAVERERNAHTNDIHNALYMATGIPGNAAAIREALKESNAILAVVRGDEYEEDITRQIDRNTDTLAAPALIVAAVNERDRLRDQLAAALRLADECSRDAAAVHAGRARAVEEAQSEANRRADRLADIVRRTVETLEQVYKHADMTDALREVVVETQREARDAIGEGQP